MLIQWTRVGNGVSGSMQEAIEKRHGHGISSESKALTGTINGKGVSVQAGTEALVGRAEGEGFSVSLPGQEGRVIEVQFTPGTVSGYNEAVEGLIAKEYASPCHLYLENHEDEVVFVGPNAPEECQSFIKQFATQGEWTLEAQRGERRAVCELSRGPNEAAVLDGGAQEYGTQDCQGLQADGWSGSAPQG